MRIFGMEPAAIAGLVGAIISLVVSFGIKLSPDQIGAVMAVTTAILGLIVRSQVSPTGKKVPAPEVKPTAAATSGAGTTPNLVPPGSANV